MVNSTQSQHLSTLSIQMTIDMTRLNIQLALLPDNDRQPSNTNLKHVNQSL